MGIVIPLLVILLTCLVIWRACDGFEIASEYLGRNLSEGVRGGTINAISSSIPELLTTFIALFFLKDEEGFAIGLGTTAGSALFNGMIIPAACIFSVIGATIAGRKVTSIDVHSKVILRDGLALLICEVAVLILLTRPTLDWWQGGILILMYLVYLAYMLLSMRRNPSGNVTATDADEAEGDDDDQPAGWIAKVFYWISGGPLLDLERAFIREKHTQRIHSETWNAWPMLLTSVAVIGVACYVLVMACHWLGSGPANVDNPGYSLLGFQFQGLGMASVFVAVIFASMATSVPDTVMSIRDARDGDYDDAVANALGSNVFDIGFALGLPLFAYTLAFGPIQMPPEIAQPTSQILSLLLILTTAAFLVYFIGPRTTADDGARLIRMGRPKATWLLALYATFVLYVVGTVSGWAWTETISSWLTYK
ncbi:putative calcium/sodium:proton antiporter [Crateriforma conspicua]|uniref:Putative calcium/sodium:proton antiporter n=1 Tax=Crateriforma conspicua TaxID=2527996 RepID=A0A5C6FPC0_9PLAN|nr:sodium:calcium antiporter [Crateriforma conspicua]TWU63249.1 putative calcium/sodium:proton antiporter [Crateriforma conspicua]